MIKAVLVFALIVFVANTGTTGTTGTFFEGLSQKLGLTSAQVEDGNTCLNGLGDLIAQLQTLLENPEQNVESMGNTLLAFYQDARSQVQEDCEAFVGDIMSVLTQSMTPPRGSTSGTIDYEAIIQANLETYFPQIVQQLGGMTNQLLNGQQLGAGSTAAYVLQILVGIAKPAVTNMASSTMGGKYVPFDLTKFVPKFFDAFFKTLGIQTTSKDLVSCVALVQKLSAENDKFLLDAPKLALFDKLDRSSTLYGKFVDTVQGCQGAIKIGDLTIGRIIRAVTKNPSRYLYQIFYNTVLAFPTMEQTFEMELGYLFQGQYDLAGRIDALRVQAMLKGVVNFATAEVM
jgi:hypothetical protein